ncbi:thiamine biosynthesis lipoprotein [Thermocatellispora tengchongensis]|uniref:Thiamine biosynthesis lipoprotein n=1 Tax=Thermocatellispora tengchongensis TaxID=1073253 RepID=A0A840P5E4_9ACTN|nr:FAD:protein FMN transferase [Thermocatellispora tengchongensis]MBB5132437.1 thiamine biosynthesis lipoprotein [Thermocatellispora tengchongensis]
MAFPRFPGTTRVGRVLGLPLVVEARTALPARELGPLLNDAFRWLRRMEDAPDARLGEVLERLSRGLSTAGVVDHRVDAGNAVRVRGSARPGERWRIGVRDPRTGAVRKMLFAHDLAVATAGGLSSVESVTVVGPDLAAAEAHAGEIAAMPLLPARRYAARLGAEGPYQVLLVDAERRAVSTPGLARYAPTAWARRMAG